MDEPVAGQLALALHRSSRTDEALAQYQVSRRHLAEELGVDPGPELQRGPSPDPDRRVRA